MPDSKQPSPRQNNEALATLSAAFPVFRDCLPLAVGIHKAIREKLPEIDRQKLRDALRIHTNSTRYLKALTQGESRFDLDGNPSGCVTPEHLQQAKDMVRERFKKMAERKQAEQQAQQLQDNILKLAEKFNAR